jgi:hypothetical protein
MIEVPSFGPNVYFHGKDWHRTREDAEKRALEMIDKRLKAIEKEVKKLIDLRASLKG